MTDHLHDMSHLSSQRIVEDDPLLKAVAGYFDRFGWPDNRARILIALSGGPDSVALLCTLRVLALTREWTLGVAHVNYHLRDDDSAADEAFCRRLCDTLNLKCHVHTVPALTNRTGNVQDWARRIRYSYFEELLHSEAYNRVAIGHTLDDHAESVAAAVLEARGTFALAGIPPCRETIIRPLFDATRSQVMDFLARYDIPYRIDQSNESTAYLRNRIRHDVLPQWRELNPAISGGLARLGEQLWEQNVYMMCQAEIVIREAQVHTAGSVVLMDRKRLMNAHKALMPFVLRAMCARLKLNLVPTAATVARFNDLCRTEGSGRLEQGQLMIEKSKGVITFLRRDEPGDKHDAAIAVKPGGTVVLGSTCLHTEILEHASGEQHDDRSEAVFDWNQLRSPLVLRRWQPGDRYQPFGLKGHKALADMFADRNVPLSQRPNIPILTDAEGILWPIGHPIADRAKVTPQTTSALHVTVVS